LFGIPLIYTMEVWWIGASVSPALMLLTLVVTTVVVFLMNRTAGFRKTRSMTWTNAVLDTIEAMALGLLCAGFILILLRKVTFSTQLTGALGIIIFESVPFALGVTLANQFLQGDPNQDLSQEPPDNLNETLTDIGVTLIGAVIIAFSIAPTEEVPELAAAVSGGWLLAIIAVSLLLSYGVVFQASFANQPKRLQQRGLFQDPVSETLVSYIISLLASMLMLWFFHQVSFEDPWSLIFRYTVLLGLPATIGGAAGRLAI
jgi:putative integral membrane protein (TIGR02587 family)